MITQVVIGSEYFDDQKWKYAAFSPFVREYLTKGARVRF